MRRDFFQQQVERLRKVYSSNSLNEERVKILWERFKNEREDIFENALNHLIAEATSQQLPALSRFAEAVGFFRIGTQARIYDAAEAFTCARCRDFGFLFEGDIVIGCSCALGRSQTPQTLARHQAAYDRGRSMFPTPQSLLRAYGGQS